MVGSLDTYQCVYHDCDFIAMDNEDLFKHYCKKHGSGLLKDSFEPLLKRCSMCKHKTIDYHKLALHYKRFHKTLTCVYCAKPCTTIKRLSNHLKKCLSLLRVLNRPKQARTTTTKKFYNIKNPNIYKIYFYFLEFDSKS
jgi:hypothetical protein